MLRSCLIFRQTRSLAMSRLYPSYELLSSTFFRDFLREKRLALGRGLRSFCLENGLDASNYSKIERGAISPPSHEKIKEYTRFLNIEENSDEWLSLFDLASIAKKRYRITSLTTKNL